MKIQGRKNQSISPMSILGAPTAGPTSQVEAAEPPAGDSVELASTTQVRQLNAMVQAMPTVRTEKVQGLRGAIEEGSYYVESDKLAKKVVDEALAEVLMAQRESKDVL
jgi:negative regulator of flagellin synthesis FlgM